MATLRPLADQDWSATAGQLRWTCSQTATHVADDLIAYASQLVSQTHSGYLPFRLRSQRQAPPGGQLDVIAALGALLALTVRTAPVDARGYHAYGEADSEGFAALGTAEVIIHSYDIATGLGAVYQPDPDICRWLLARLHRDVREYDDPWAALRWATGRGDLPGHAPVRRWRWHAAPAEAEPAPS